MTIDDGSILLPPCPGKTVSLQGNQLTFVHRDPAGAYSLIDWITPPDLPSPLYPRKVTARLALGSQGLDRGLVLRLSLKAQVLQDVRPFQRSVLQRLQVRMGQPRMSSHLKRQRKRCGSPPVRLS